MEITRVTFTPKRNAPVDCTEVFYLVNESNWAVAESIAKLVLIEENKHYSHYDKIIVSNQRVL